MFDYKENRKGAISLSVSTMIVIVIGVVMLVLLVPYIKDIIDLGKGSVDTLDQKIQSELQTMLGDEEGLIITYTKNAEVKAGADGFGFPIAARTPRGESIGGRNDMQYMLLDSGIGNCRDVEELFLQEFDRWNSVDDFEADSSFSLIIINVPKGTELCTHKINVDVRYDGDVIGGTSFTLNVIRGSLF